MLLNDMCINKPITDEQLTITLAAIKIMELLVELTEDHLSKYHGDLCYALKREFSLKEVVAKNVPINCHSSSEANRLSCVNTELFSAMPL